MLKIIGERKKGNLKLKDNKKDTLVLQEKLKELNTEIEYLEETVKYCVFKHTETELKIEDTKDYSKILPEVTIDIIIKKAEEFYGRKLSKKEEVQYYYAKSEYDITNDVVYFAINIAIEKSEKKGFKFKISKHNYIFGILENFKEHDVHTLYEAQMLNNMEKLSMYSYYQTLNTYNYQKKLKERENIIKLLNSKNI